MTAVGVSAQEPAGIPAFPGAEGFGAFAQGGRGGAVHLVTTLEDYAAGEAPIEGSLRAAVEAEGPRTVVFRVSGYVELKRMLEIDEPYLTIAGQTAPGDGVALKNYGIDIDADEVVIRHLRIRPGDASGEELDAVNIRSSNVIVDHCSASWATDETISVIGDATNVTVQWCLIAESLNESVHSKGEHGYGSLISTAGNVTMHHNAYAFHKSRNPRPRDALLDFRNNVIFGWGDRAGYNEDDRTRMNYVSNYLLPLPYSDNSGYAFLAGGPDARLFVEGNLLRRPDGTQRTDWQLIRADENRGSAKDLLAVEQPFAAPTVTTEPAEAALESVLDDVGATRPARDAVDRRVIDLMRERTGAIIDSQEEVGGWLPLQGGTAPPDADRDGMDDRWEEQFGLDPRDDGDHAGDLDGDGYTNLEEYLNETDPTTAYGWLEPPTIRPESGAVFTQPPLYVTMTAPEPNVPIHYTTDGREPTAASPVYERPVQIFDDAHVRARLATERPTATAFAAYEHIGWMSPRRRSTGATEPGIRFAIYEAADWDEGVTLEALQPVLEGVTDRLDFALRPEAGANAVVFDGWLEVPHGGIYEFYFQDDVRSRLFLNGQVVAQGSPPASAPARIALREGFYRLHLRSLHEEPRPTRLEWRGPGIERGAIASSHFSHALQTGVSQVNAEQR